MAFEIVCCMMSWDSSVYNHLTPIARHPLVSRLWIIRPQKSLFGEIPKAEYLLTPSVFKPIRWFKMLKACLKLGARKEVRAFVSFNPIPYGLIAYCAAKQRHKPIHLGFIGADWNKYSKGPFGKIFMRAYHNANFITATGQPMKDEMIAGGLREEQISLLPHPIDLDKFPVANPEDAQYTCIFVGELIQRKRVDIILKAFAKVRKSRPESQLCIVGDGPLASNLKKQAAELTIADAVDFVGFANNVQPYIEKSKMILIASDSEGFPFSLVEGICCGLVPVSTPVGTITDTIIDGENGLLFPQGDSDALADKILQLLEEPELYNSIRSKVLELRKRFSYEMATAVWDLWFQTLDNL